MTKMNHWIYFGVAFLFMVYSVFTGLHSMVRYREFLREYEWKQHALNENTKKKQHLIDKLSNLNDDNTWELLSRQKLGMVKADELVFTFHEKNYDRPR